MVNGSKKNKRFFLYLTIFGFLFFNCSTAKADETIIYVQANLNERYVHYDKVISKYGTIWIGYTIAHGIITTDSGEERFIIEKANYYYKNENNYILLGSIDKTGLYDNNGNNLKPVSRVATGFHVMGVSSSLLVFRKIQLT